MKVLELNSLIICCKKAKEALLCLHYQFAQKWNGRQAERKIFSFFFLESAKAKYQASTVFSVTLQVKKKKMAILPVCNIWQIPACVSMHWSFSHTQKLCRRNMPYNKKVSRLMAQLKTWDTYWCLWWQTYRQGFSSDFEQFFLVKKQLCVFLRNKYGFHIGNAMEKVLLFWFSLNREKLSLHLSLSTPYAGD